MHNKENYALISRFNTEAQNSLRHDLHSDWLTTKNVNELHHFEKCGKLSERGKREFWS